MRKIILSGAIFCLSFLSAYAGTFTRGNWTLSTNTSNAELTINYGTTTVINKSRTAFRNAAPVANPSATNVSTMSSISSENSTAITDNFGSGIKVTLVGAATGGGALGLTVTQDFYFYDGLDYFLTEFTITSPTEMTCNYMAPIYCNGTGNQTALPNNTNNRVLEVPYHNDDFIRYISNSFSSSGSNSAINSSYEVGAAYNESSRKGLVAGSIEHHVWKTGVDFVTRSNYNIFTMHVYGGRAVMPNKSNSPTQIHGAVKGKSIKSPKIFVGYFNDWRDALEAYGDANAIATPKVEWYGRKPFGWNSWGVIGGNLDYANATQSADWMLTELKANGFHNDNTQYIGLDSFWDNMTGNQLFAFPWRLQQNGQKAGIYGGGYVHWDISSDGSGKVGNSDYTWGELYLKYNGIPQAYDDARALDPTHPGTKAIVENQINQALMMGYRYIKLDFMVHASLEADSWYDPNITTGAMAYDYALKHTLTYLKNHPLYPQDDDVFIDLSIAPIFPANYTHGRRISCDIYNGGGLSMTQYALNSLTYGWWLDHAYPYNDGDMTILNGQSTAASRSRVTAAVITGIFSSGDDLSNGGSSAKTTAKNNTKTFFTNADVNELARHCKSFRPVASGTAGNNYDNAANAADLYMTKIGDITYVAAFNFGTLLASSKSINFTNLGLSGSYTVKELWAGTTNTRSATWSESVPASDAKILKIYPTGTSGNLPALPPIPTRPAPPVQPPVVIPSPVPAIHTALSGAAPGPNWEIIKDPNSLGYRERGRLLWGDYNNDGHLDAFFISNTAGFELYKNNGDESFTSMTATLPVEMIGYPMRHGSALFLDYNNDGNLDLITMGVTGSHGFGNSEAVTIAYKNSGAPDYRFVYDRENTVNLRGGRSKDDMQGRLLQAVDFDHDGWTDLVVTGELASNRFSGWRLTAYYKNNQGLFQQQTNVVNNANIPQISAGNIHVGDVNGDGFADLITVGYGESVGGYVAKLYINSGNGAFTESPYSTYLEKTWSERGEIILADLNSDGLDDIIEIGGWYGNIHINNGNGTSFTKYTNPSSLPNKDCVTISVGDVNNDGKLDILVAGMGNPNTTVFYNNGGGNSFTTLNPPAQISARSGNTCFVDINGDGNLDMSAFGYNDATGWVNSFALNKLGNSISANTAPSIPDNFNISYSGGKYHLTWSRSTDDKTPQAAIRYNVYARNYDDGKVYAYAPAHEATGKLKVQDGLVHLLATNSYDWALPQTNTYYTFGVSAVDQSNMASAFNLVEFPEVPTIVWTGATDTNWEKRSNWTPNIVPDAKKKVLIPAGKTNYPVLTGNASAKTLFMEKGATIELNNHTLSASESVTVQTFMDPKKWYSISFPFDIETVYSVLFESDLTPWSHFWLKEYNSSTRLFEQTTFINEMGGYILQLPTGYPNGTEIHYISGPINGLTKRDLTYQNDTYILQANPTLGSIAINGAALAASNQYVYKLDLAVSPDYLLVEGNTTVAPFEAIATFKKGVMMPVPRISLGENEVTDIDNGRIAPPDVILSKTLYNMQGQAIEKPQQGSVYIEKTIFQSGKTKVVKQIK